MKDGGRLVPSFFFSLLCISLVSLHTSPVSVMHLLSFYFVLNISPSTGRLKFYWTYIFSIALIFKLRLQFVSCLFCLLFIYLLIRLVILFVLFIYFYFFLLSFNFFCFSFSFFFSCSTSTRLDSSVNVTSLFVTTYHLI